jgi:VWFA-related protein
MKGMGLLFSAVLLLGLVARSQGVPAGGEERGGQDAALLVLTLGTDEVHVTFHAMDEAGRPVVDLTSLDFQVLDNGKTPLRLLRFDHVGNLPIRAGLIFDTSRSVLGEIKENRAIAGLYASQLLRLGMDRGFLLRFDSDSKVLQDWTDAKAELLHGLESVGDDYQSRMGGTKLYDSVYKACRDQWRERPDMATGNFILLFTDGLDNASNAHFNEVVEMCQQRQVAIYVVTREAKVRSDAGQRVLNDLTMQTGGSIIFTKTDDEVAQALDTIRHTVEDRYTLVYKPRLIKRDGKFHKLRLDCLQRCSEIKGPSGYYAPR